MGGFAWVTLATNDSYSLGALVLAHSLKNVRTSHQLAVLVTPGVTKSMREKLSGVFNIVQEVNILDSKDEANLRLLKRPELGVTFTKLHCWRLTQFDKCVFLDADTLVLKNSDELFDREELSAAPDVGWPDCFNSGVFVYRPSNQTYEKLVQFALETGSFDGGDQGLLNLYFSDWASKDISKHLPFIYNLCSTACYSYLPAFKQFGADTKIIHFIGSSKPWLQYFNTETQRVQPSSDLKHLEDILQHWWNIFCSLIHPQLTREMAPSSSDVTHTSTSSCTSHDLPQYTIWDPWEEYDQKQSHQTNLPDPYHDKFEPSQIQPVESHNTNAYHASHEHHDHFSEPAHADPIYSLPISYPESHSPPSKPVTPPPRPLTPPLVPRSLTPPPRLPRLSTHFPPSSPPPLPPPTAPTPPPTSPPRKAPTPPPPSPLPKAPTPPAPQPELLTRAPPPKPITPLPSVQTSESEAAATVCNETAKHTEEFSGGLAGAFAQLTLGAPRTAEQSALDDHLRRQGWEVGNIDYMGKDSFDNIWSKICETLSAGSPAEKTTEETPRTPAEEPVAPTATEAPPPAEPPKPVSETTQSIPLEPAAPTDAPQCPLPPKQETEPLQCPLKPKEGSQPVAAAIETFSPIIAKGTPEPVPVVTEQPPVVAPVALPTPPPEQVSVVPSAKEQVDAATEQAPIPATVQEQPSLPSPVPEHPSVPSPVTEQPQVVTPVVQQPPTVPTPATEEPKSATPVVEQPPAVASVTEQPPIATPVTEELPIAAPITKQLPIAAPVPEQPPLATAAPEQPPIAAPVPEQPLLAAAAPEQPPLAAAAPEQPPIAAAAPEQPPIAAAAPEQPPLAAAVPEQPKVATVPVSEQPPQRSGSEPTAEVLASSEAGSEQLKSVSKTKSEASGAAAASPTPPPRKSGGGGGKKPKTKK